MTTMYMIVYLSVKKTSILSNILGKWFTNIAEKLFMKSTYW